MTWGPLDYSRADGLQRAAEQARARRPIKTKREQAADLINAGRKLAREALEEEQREAAMVAEYGPKLKG